MMASVHSGVMSPRLPNQPDESTFRGRVGAILRRRREQLGLSVSEVAESIGVATQTLYSWEQGHNPVPTDRLPHIAAALKTKVRRLFPDE
jgi:transcriptional regulator with XRE-family HTH domain